MGTVSSTLTGTAALESTSHLFAVVQSNLLTGNQPTNCCEMLLLMHQPYGPSVHDHQ